MFRWAKAAFIKHSRQRKPDPLGTVTPQAIVGRIPWSYLTNYVTISLGFQGVKSILPTVSWIELESDLPAFVRPGLIISEKFHYLYKFTIKTNTYLH